MKVVPFRKNFRIVISSHRNNKEKKTTKEETPEPPWRGGEKCTEQKGEKGPPIISTLYNIHVEKKQNKSTKMESPLAHEKWKKRRKGIPDEIGKRRKLSSSFSGCQPEQDRSIAWGNETGWSASNL